MKKILSVFLCICAFAPMANAQLVINELMQSNINCLFADNEFPDSWVEIYNTQNIPVCLTGYKLADNEEGVGAYTLAEDLEVPALGYLLLYCDKEGYGRHTDFRLDSGKGGVYLFDADGNLIDGVAFKKMPAPNIAYGRTKDGGDKWGYFIDATPGSANIGTTAKDLSPAPVFSGMGSGLVSEPGSITVGLPDEGPEDMVLCITTDGREPGISDAVDGREVVLSIDKTSIIRAKIISPATLAIPSTVRSYIFHPEPTELTVFSIVTDPDHLYHPEHGIITGKQGEKDNFRQDWRRPLNLEVFDCEDNHAESINQLCELRIHGGFSRENPQKSFAVYANKRFGTKRFNSSHFWPDKPEIAETKSFVLRNGGNDFWFSHMRDQLAQTISGRNVESQLDWMAYRPVICYINGEYAGIYDLRERSNEDFVEANHNTENFDMVENWCEVKNGTIDELQNFMRVFMKDDLSLDELYSQADVDGFVDMLIINTFAANTDFISNNFICWRPWEGDSRWRFLLKDIDRNALPFVEPSYNYFEFIRDFADGHDPAQWGRDLSKLFRIFVDEKEFSDLFTQRLAIALGDYLQPTYTHSVVDEMIGAMYPELVRHGDLYFPKQNRIEYILNDVALIKDLYNSRNDEIYGQMSNYFNLGKPVPLAINKDGKSMRFHGMKLTQPEFNGKWFEGETVSLTTEYDNPLWQVITLINDDEGQIEKREYFEGSMLEFTVPSNCGSIKIWLADATGIECPTTPEITDATVYDLTGRRVGSSLEGLKPGVYVQGGKKILVK